MIPDLPCAEELMPYLRRIDCARWYSNFGPLVGELEGRLQSLLAARDPCPWEGDIHVATLATGHAALEAGLRLLGVCAGKKVLVPAITFPACPLAVERLGGEVLLADVDPHTWRLEPAGARAAAEHLKLDVLMPVATYGIPVPVAEWDTLSKDTGIPVLIDAAAALETQVIPRRGLVAHSFHATKPFGVGEGGALIGRDPTLGDRVRQYANFGLVDHVARVDGTNAKMSEYHAAVGLAQLERWDEIKARRRHLLQLYLQQLASLGAVARPQPALTQAVVSLLMVLLQGPTAADVMARAGLAGIAMHRTYLPPLYRHPRFEHLGVVDADGNYLPPQAGSRRKRAHMPVSEWLCDRLLGLPFHHLMSEADVAAAVGMLLQSADVAACRVPA